jgi:FRG domain
MRLDAPIFANLLNCLSYLSSSLCLGKSSTQAPRYLFRGERKFWPTTLTLFDRIEAKYSDLRVDVSDELDSIVAWIMVNTWSVGGKELDHQDTGAYAQHYGFPTQIFDFTAHLGVAAFFSLADPTQFSSSDPDDRHGLITVLDTTVAHSNGHTLRDLRKHPFARRACRQHAFGLITSRFVASQTYDDLKSGWHQIELGLRNYMFLHRSEEAGTLGLSQHSPPDKLLDTAQDPFVTLSEQWLDRYVAARGPLTEETVRELRAYAPHLGKNFTECLSRWAHPTRA